MDTPYKSKSERNEAFINRGKMYRSQEFNINNTNLKGFYKGIRRDSIVGISQHASGLLVTCIHDGVRIDHVIRYNTQPMPDTVEGDLKVAKEYMEMREKEVRKFLNADVE